MPGELPCKQEAGARDNQQGLVTIRARHASDPQWIWIVCGTLTQSGVSSCTDELCAYAGALHRLEKPLAPFVATDALSAFLVCHSASRGERFPCPKMTSSGLPNC